MCLPEGKSTSRYGFKSDRKPDESQKRGTGFSEAGIPKKNYMQAQEGTASDKEPKRLGSDEGGGE